MGPKEAELVELSDAIDVVRRELVKAHNDGEASTSARSLSFAVARVVVEFTGEVTKTVGAGGGIKFWS